ncbi:MAG: hypothetical protein IJ649_00140 [Oscillospiraceae bacterium]|nr:hypothetical protein [Oscillospiraceae bacterium]
MDSMEEIRIRAPGPRACKLCAARHKPGMPHDRDSLYYQNKFWRRYKRFPTWNDAMAHCTEEVKAAFVKELANRGIYVEIEKGSDG